ncbi:hypothetical protein EXIGLDRAFT_692853 [Exidia glandulosa HHB12029]|uniref:Uncharacterized protein n=1 Tax=Exidia glandulosa HHB12029 TaxID=1314781 RepID=A0A165NXC9_EXIGL|nr:hypothetical protein EXIGLDRAFT_692853 [Exidia glandulosa HHB12029]
MSPMTSEEIADNYAADVFRYQIGTPEAFTLEDGPAMWLENGDVVEVALAPSTPESIAPLIARAIPYGRPTGPVHRITPCPVPIDRLAAGQTSSSDDAQPSQSVPPVRRNLIRRNYTYAPADFDGGARHTIDLGLSVQGKKGEWKRLWGKAHGAVVYRVGLDTSSAASWVWGLQDKPNVVDGRIRSNGTSNNREIEEQHSFWDRKATVPYPPGLTQSQISQRSSHIRDAAGATLDHCDSPFSEDGPQFDIEYFPLGVAYAYSASLLATHEDGILGLAPEPRESPDRGHNDIAPELKPRSLHTHLAETGMIEVAYLRHSTLDPRSKNSSITFGSWNDSDSVLHWTSIATLRAGWRAHLQSISMSLRENIHGEWKITWESPVVNVDCDAVFDIDAVNTYLPRGAIRPIREIMATLTHPAGGNDVVPGLSVNLTGQGERFLRTHWRRGNITRVLPIVPGRDSLAVLGSRDTDYPHWQNFFHTFIVGFVDGTSPCMRFAPQRWLPIQPGNVFDRHNTP